MKYLSVCSGISAATIAWKPLGFSPVAFCEFSSFPSAVLAHHWPDVPNLGDMTKWQEWPDEIFLNADILEGGTPCQAFSVAGLRQSLGDARGNLTLTYVQILDQIDRVRARHGRPPAVCVWENVPGVLNTDDNAFGCFLAALAGEEFPLEPPGGRWTDAGYVRGPKRAIAWRSLDAQYFGLAQRRQRVFVVAGAGEGFRHEEVLFEFEGMRRDSPPSRGKGEGTSRGFETGPSGGGFTDLYPTLDTRCKDGPIQNQSGGGVIESYCMATGQAGAEIGIGIGTTLNCNHEAPIVTQEIVSTLDANYGKLQGCSGQDANHGHSHLVATAFKASHFTRGKDGSPSDIAPPLSADADKGDQDTLICVHGTQDPCTDENLAFALGRNSGQENAIAFSCKDHGADAGPISPTLRSMGHDGSHANGGGQVAVCFDTTQITSAENRSNPKPGDPCHPLAAGAHPPAIAFQPRYFTRDNKTGNAESCGDLIPALSAQHSSGDSAPHVASTMAVRRLTPVECARLQGFPDHHTDIKPKGKPTPDGPQYKAYGNSMAVTVMHWIGRRLSTKHSV